MIPGAIPQRVSLGDGRMGGAGESGDGHTCTGQALQGARHSKLNAVSDKVASEVWGELLTASLRYDPTCSCWSRGDWSTAECVM